MNDENRKLIKISKDTINNIESCKNNSYTDELIILLECKLSEDRMSTLKLDKDGNSPPIPRSKVKEYIEEQMKETKAILKTVEKIKNQNDNLDCMLDSIKQHIDQNLIKILKIEWIEPPEWEDEPVE